MKWLKRLVCVGALLVGLILPPTMMDQGYRFLESLPNSITFEWTKNPYGKPIKNYATGVTADVHHFAEVETHWDLAGEVVLDWEDKKVFPFAYFYDILADNYKIVMSNKEHTLMLGAADTEGGARMTVLILYAKLRGLYFKPVEIEEQQEIRHISLTIAKTENDILSLRNPSFGFKCDVTLSKIEQKDDGYYEQAFYANKWLNPGDSYEVSMEPGDYFWQLECWKTSDNQPVGRWYGELRFPTPDINDEIVIRDGKNQAL